MGVQLRAGQSMSEWLAIHIERVRWVESGAVAAIGVHESSREEVAADIQHGIEYVVISGEGCPVRVSVHPARPELNFLRAFPEGSRRDRIVDVPAYP